MGALELERGSKVLTALVLRAQVFARAPDCVSPGCTGCGKALKSRSATDTEACTSSFTDIENYWPQKQSTVTLAGMRFYLPGQTVFWGLSTDT